VARRGENEDGNNGNAPHYNSTIGDLLKMIAKDRPKVRVIHNMKLLGSSSGLVRQSLLLNLRRPSLEAIKEGRVVPKNVEELIKEGGDTSGDTKVPFATQEFYPF